jgi:hypothetical protein
MMINSHHQQVRLIQLIKTLPPPKQAQSGDVLDDDELNERLFGASSSDEEVRIHVRFILHTESMFMLFQFAPRASSSDGEEVCIH